MSLEVEPFLAAVGLMIVGAFAGSLVFRRFRLPDIVFLIALGVLLGPILHFVDPAVFRAIVPLVGTIAIIIILFDGGLNIRLHHLASGVGSGTLLALIVFTATALLAAFVGMHGIGLPGPQALLLGMALGGAGVVIVIPLIQHLGVTDRAKVIVSIEAATSDVLVVVGVVGLSTALSIQQANPAAFAKTTISTFAVGVALGLAAGFAWAAILRRFAERSYEYVLTIAALFLLYAAVELMKGSGALAVLAFGLVVGNSRKTQRVESIAAARKKGRRNWVYAPVFGIDLLNLHHELVFFIRAFFFVALGVVVNLDVLTSPRFLALGFLLTAAVVLGRFYGVVLLFRKTKMPDWDKLAITLMFPLGLAAAALSVLPHDRFGIPHTQDFGSYAAVVIVLTNLFSSGLVYLTNYAWFRRQFEGAPRELPEPQVGTGRPWGAVD